MRSSAKMRSSRRTPPACRSPVLPRLPADRQNFIGLHFFSPVERMQMVEIVVGKETSQETLAKAWDYILQIKKAGHRRQRQPGLLHKPGLRDVHFGGQSPVGRRVSSPR